MPSDDSSLVIHEGAGAGGEHPVHGELILGREQPSADVVIPDPGVSRRHARVLPHDGTILVEDLGSSNGTYLNGRRITGPVELATGDELQLGDTVIGLRRSAGTPRRPGPTPRRLPPPPHQPSNIPALAALFLGPLSILLVFLSTGGFFIALPCGISAVILGTIGIRNADRRQAGHRGLARLGRITGIIGTILATIALIVFVVVAAALHSTESSVNGLVTRIKHEIDNVQVPDVNAPDNGGTKAPPASTQ